MKYKTLNKKLKSNTNPTKISESNPVLWDGKQFMFHMWNPSYYSDKERTRL